MDAVDVRRWLVEVDDALGAGGDVDVPCGECTACCTSGQFVLVEPDDVGARARIPAELLFPAPRAPEGFSLLGYDERGHCPMLVDGRCSIYEHRPRTCRTYDCRVLAAAGVDVAADGKPAIAAATARWSFSAGSEDDAAELQALRRAAAFLRARADELPDDVRPITETHVAIAAVRVRDAFRDPDAAPTTAALIRHLRPSEASGPDAGQDDEERGLATTQNS